MENTSGQGKQAILPPKLAGRNWNWGAFLLNWLWGIFNKTFIALLIFVPIINIVMPFILGFKGNAWAWRNKRWESFDHFRQVQRKWAIWGVICLVVSLLVTAGGVFYIFEEIKNSEPYIMAMDKVQVDKEAVNILGAPIKPGWWCTGNVTVEDQGGNAELAIPVTGSARQGMVNVKAIRDKHKWKIEILFLTPDGGGAALDLLKAPKVPPAPTPPAVPAGMPKVKPADDKPVVSSPPASVAPSVSPTRKPIKKARLVKNGDLAADHWVYAIHLKTGGQFLTPKYWEERQEIKFYIAGGVLGIEKDTVKKIEKSKMDAAKYEINKSEQVILPVNQTPEKIINKEPIPDAKVKEVKVDLKAYQDKMAKLKTDLNKTLTRIRQATASNYTAAKDEATADNRMISAEMWKLTDELKGKNNDNLPADWWEGMGREEPSIQ